MKKTHLKIFALMLIASSFTYTEDGKASKLTESEKTFAQADANKDGVIVLEEFKNFRPPHMPFGMSPPKSMLESKFKSLDADQDGKVNIQEFEKGKPAPKKSTFN